MSTVATTAGSAPGFAKHPDYRVIVEPCPRRVRVEFNDEFIADSTEVLVLLESNHVPVYYFPADQVRLDLMERTERTTFCPFKGEASYRSLLVGDKEAEDAVWCYQTPFDEARAIKNHLAFYWNKVDRWFEEDEEIFVHPRDPHKRIDAIKSSRPVTVVIGGEEVAETEEAVFLFETGMPTRYYIPPQDIRMDFLTSTETKTRCPYKGSAVYWSVMVGGETFEDIVWSYPDPLPEVGKIKGYYCFFNENVDAIVVDGQKTEQVQTKWSTRFLPETLDGPEHIV